MTTLDGNDVISDISKYKRDHNYVPAVHIITALFYIIVRAWLITTYGSLDNFDSTTIAYYEVISIVAAMLIFILEMRIKTAEVLKGLVDESQRFQALLETKKQSVRYISHEIRTPLNAATLGLGFIIKGMRKKLKNTPEDIELRETLNDAQSACKTAVETLNDLLCFDKLENGLLTLNKQNVNARHFIKTCVAMFSGQARERGLDVVIKLIDITQYVDSPECKTADTTVKDAENSARILNLEDTFSGDRFKLEQVLRNLISNAIKFTPNGKQVTICAYFMPTIVPVHDENNMSKHIEVKKKNETSKRISSVLRRYSKDFNRNASTKSVGPLIGGSEYIESTKSLYIESGSVHNNGKTGDEIILAHEQRRIEISLNSSIGRSWGRHSSDPIRSLWSSQSEKVCVDNSSVIENGVSVAAAVDNRIDGGTNNIGGGSIHLCDSRHSPLSTESAITGGMLIIKVVDQGAGISPENQKKLFKQIVQFDPVSI